MKNNRFKFFMTFGLIFLIAGTAITAGAYGYGKKYYVPEVENFAQNFDVDFVNYIQINNVSVSVSVERGDRFSVVAENIPKGMLRCELIDNKLRILMKNNSNINIGFLVFPDFPSMRNTIFLNETEKAKIYIYIPEGKRFNEISIEGNVGNIKADYLKCDKLLISSNVGNVHIDNFETDMLNVNKGVGNVNILGGTIGENGNINMYGRIGLTKLELTEPAICDVDMNGGVGNININATINGKVSIEGGTGNITWNGAINGDAEFNVGIGNTNLNLKGNLDDYNIHASQSGMGSVYINELKSDSGYGDYDRQSSEAKYNIYINAGIGSIKLNIE